MARSSRHRLPSPPDRPELSSVGATAGQIPGLSWSDHRGQRRRLPGQAAAFCKCRSRTHRAVGRLRRRRKPRHHALGSAPCFRHHLRAKWRAERRERFPDVHRHGGEHRQHGGHLVSGSGRWRNHHRLRRLHRAGNSGDLWRQSHLPLHHRGLTRRRIDTVLARRVANNDKRPRSSPGRLQLETGNSKLRLWRFLLLLFLLLVLFDLLNVFAQFNE